MKPLQIIGHCRRQKPEYIKKYWLKENLKEIKNLINNQTFILDDLEKGYPVKPFMDDYKENIQYDASLDKL